MPTSSPGIDTILGNVVGATGYRYDAMDSAGNRMDTAKIIANPSGIYAVYSMREVFEFDRFWAIGSGRDFALGAMYTVYDKARDARKIAEAGVLAGAEFDTGTSLPLTAHEVALAP